MRAVYATIAALTVGSAAALRLPHVPLPPLPQRSAGRSPEPALVMRDPAVVQLRIQQERDEVQRCKTLLQETVIEAQTLREFVNEVKAHAQVRRAGPIPRFADEVAN